MVLDAPPTGDVTVTIASDNSDVTVDTDSEMAGNQDTLTFTADDSATAQTVTVSAASDVDNMDEAAKLSHAVSSADAKFNRQALIDAAVAAALADVAADATDEAKAMAEASAMKSLDVTVNVTDTSAGVRIDPTELKLTEITAATGDVDRYTVVLQKAPTADVTVRIATDNADVTFAGGSHGTYSDAMIGEVDVTDAVLTLTFTPGNYAQAQNVVVEVATDDGTDDESAMLTHTVVSSDFEYDGLTVAPVPVAVADDTRAPGAHRDQVRGRRRLGQLHRVPERGAVARHHGDRDHHQRQRCRPDDWRHGCRDGGRSEHPDVHA